ncbi:MAG: pyrroloquinoline quinone precursor peptide PqqA [Acetobacteraceae bacterium]|nr:pyrroloquinoline quinone precursor peptide PqqA [Acetobacteraceae bacterium]
MDPIPQPRGLERRLLDPGAYDAQTDLSPFWEEMLMAWKKPRVTEICLALEINCYASAGL